MCSQSRWSRAHSQACVMRLAGISFPLGSEISSGESLSFVSLPCWSYWAGQLSPGLRKMLCLCLYVPVLGERQTEFEYFESKGLPAELKSIFRLSLLIPSQEFSTYRQWKQVWPWERNGEVVSNTCCGPLGRGRGSWWPCCNNWVKHGNSSHAPWQGLLNWHGVNAFLFDSFVLNLWGLGAYKTV